MEVEGELLRLFFAAGKRQDRNGIDWQLMPIPNPREIAEHSCGIQVNEKVDLAIKQAQTDQQVHFPPDVRVIVTETLLVQEYGVLGAVDAGSQAREEQLEELKEKRGEEFFEGAIVVHSRMVAALSGPIHIRWEGAQCLA